MTVGNLAKAEVTDVSSTDEAAASSEEAAAEPAAPAPTPDIPATSAPGSDTAAPAPAASQAPQGAPAASQAPSASTGRFPDAAPKQATMPPKNQTQAAAPPRATEGRKRHAAPQPAAPNRSASSRNAASGSERQQDSAFGEREGDRPSKKGDASDDEDNSGGLLGPIRLGPMVGVGLPNLLSFGGLLKLTKYLGGGINIGLIPTVHLSYYGNATLFYQEYDAFGRIFPFGGGFFVGAGAGYEVVKGTMSDSLDTSQYQNLLPPGLSIGNPLLYESSGTVKTMVLTPQIGYFYTTSIGFSLGIDVGAQVPIAPSQIRYNSQLAVPSTTPQPLVVQINSMRDRNDQEVKNSLQKVGRTPLPTINLRIGWLL
jgi:hypothetical protein